MKIAATLHKDWSFLIQLKSDTCVESGDMTHGNTISHLSAVLRNVNKRQILAVLCSLILICAKTEKDTIIRITDYANPGSLESNYYTYDAT
jgi:hypothetical protein